MWSSHNHNMAQNSKSQTNGRHWGITDHGHVTDRVTMSCDREIDKPYHMDERKHGPIDGLVQTAVPPVH